MRNRLLVVDRENHGSSPFSASSWRRYVRPGFFIFPSGSFIYLGKWISGLSWLLTAGVFGLGYLYDWLTLNEQVNEANVTAF